MARPVQRSGFARLHQPLSIEEALSGTEPAPPHWTGSQTNTEFTPPHWIGLPVRPAMATSESDELRSARIRRLLEQDRKRPVQREFIERWRAKRSDHFGATSTIPTISKEVARIKNIVEDRPARFNIIDNTNEPGNPRWGANDELALSEVLKHDGPITREADRHGLDPDLIRAIMFVENSHGWYDFIAELFGQNKTQHPMNIDGDLWRGLGTSRDAVRDPSENIRIGALLLKRLVDRVEEPTPRKIAALWNFTGVEHTDNKDVRDFAARVEKVYRDKPWSASTKQERGRK